MRQFIRWAAFVVSIFLFVPTVYFMYIAQWGITGSYFESDVFAGGLLILSIAVVLFIGSRSL